ncbi:F0F1 ATP synthase subunit B [Cardinium endosymbiont of Culicoides punctatus]|uniref:F0F1 ATP synthase subunit B n=1 Tax=Cardinium endosymbiont of Culicoides punctatus TaxID=2304601 RepID=UPI0010585553|nr:F0F1 ATP synthase subunit B [Cardinium endosymbiont of Culicoides punctatus]TDG95368.1 ATP synthase subunit b [Cardinium endosymbiont of Culicoides punctatus]
MDLITPGLGIIFWQTITFFAVLLVLSKYAWKPILEILKQREDAIAHAIGQIALSEALIKQVVSDKDKLLEEANLERERIIGEALVEKKHIMHQTNQEALKLKEHLLAETRVEISKEEKRALESIKKNMGMLAIQMAEKLLIKELSRNESQLELIERLTVSKSQSS